MRYPKVVSASALDNHILLIEFDNSEKKAYNVTPLLGKEGFSPLKNIALFKAVKVEQGEYELWRHGQAIT